MALNHCHMACGNVKSFSKFKLKISVFCCDKYYVAKLSLHFGGLFSPDSVFLFVEFLALLYKIWNSNFTRCLFFVTTELCVIWQILSWLSFKGTASFTFSVPNCYFGGSRVSFSLFNSERPNCLPCIGKMTVSCDGFAWPVSLSRVEVKQFLNNT